MNRESSSALQKASFVLLVFIAAALGYLVVRDRFRDLPGARNEMAASSARPETPAPFTPPGHPDQMKSSFAPLRPRSETNVVRVPTNRVVVVRTPSPLPEAPVVRTETVVLAVPPLPLGGLPVPVGSTVADGGTTGLGALVSGRVILQGTPPPEKTVTLDAMCGRLHPEPMTTRHFVAGQDAGLANVFVYVKSGGAPQKTTQAAMPLLDNIRCEFQPYVLGVRAGQPFQIRNSDPVLHNMHLQPLTGGGNREFNLALPVAGMTTTQMIQKPELFIKVKCDVHPWMFAYLSAVDHPWFAVTDQDGNFTLPAGLPPGTYTLAAAHLKAGETTQPLTVTGSGPLPVNFTMEAPGPLAKAGAR